MRFRVEVDLPGSPFHITRKDPLLLLGSCFSTNIGGRLQKLKFNTVLDPFGTLYDPLSIARALETIARDGRFGEDDLFEYEGRYGSFAHSTKFSGTDVQAVLDVMNDQVAMAHGQLKGAPVLMITLGTAWAFRHKEKGEVVANCHKVPSQTFERELLTVEDIVDKMRQAMQAVLRAAPQARFLFTISPVRHLRDGLINDQLGKSVLFVALNDLRKSFPEAAYFPAFELLQHELRDYRFYAEDMAHPSAQAIDFIWGKFEQHFIDAKESRISKQVQAIQAELAHRPLTTDPGALEAYMAKLGRKLKDISSRSPELDWQQEFEQLATLRSGHGS